MFSFFTILSFNNAFLFIYQLQWGRPCLVWTLTTPPSPTEWLKGQCCFSHRHQLNVLLSRGHWNHAAMKCFPDTVPNKLKNMLRWKANMYLLMYSYSTSGIVQNVFFSLFSKVIISPGEHAHLKSAASRLSILIFNLFISMWQLFKIANFLEWQRLCDKLFIWKCYFAIF